MRTITTFLIVTCTALTLVGCRAKHNQDGSQVASLKQPELTPDEMCQASAKDAKSPLGLTIAALMKSTSTPDCAAMFAKLPSQKDIQLSNRGLSNLSPLRYAEAVESLDITQNAVVDLTAIARLANLQRLYAASNKITGLPVPNQWSKMFELNVSANQINDISAVMSMTALESFDISDNQVQTIVALGNVPTLKVLFANNNRIRDLSPLSYTAGLEQVHLEKNQVFDLKPLADLRELRYVKYLNFRDNPINRAGCPIIGDSTAITTYCQNLFVNRN
ncbi:MAG: hypothetical protein RL011_2519 [Pseudomonadota bacterium]